MSLKKIINRATNRDKFTTIDDYIEFCLIYMEFIKTNLQAVIVSQNENHYRFFQYKKDGNYNVSRPINSDLMLSFEDIERDRNQFSFILDNIKEKEIGSQSNRQLINKIIYTCQQAIGASLDALPSNKSNTARKLNGELFERFIRLIILKLGVDVSTGTIGLPIKVDDSETLSMRYQHDLIIKVDEVTKAIGSVKTSSKDRIDKIFIDKFLYNRLTESNTPHFAIFLNDVQRKGKEPRYSINSTFLSGHFKVYTIKLNPLDGVYYFDIRPNMKTEYILKDHIKTFDNFIIEDIWKLMK